MGEYSPLEVKSSVVGYGRAEKHQVQMMVRSLLGLEREIESEDACDAVAVAICHANRQSTERRLAKAVS
jgi:crossover junction endodeoxyribonuclease RuvC